MTHTLLKCTYFWGNFFRKASDHQPGWVGTRQMIVSGGSRRRHRCSNMITLCWTLITLITWYCWCATLVSPGKLYYFKGAFPKVIHARCHQWLPVLAQVLLQVDPHLNCILPLVQPLFWRWKERLWHFTILASLFTIPPKCYLRYLLRSLLVDKFWQEYDCEP